MNAPQPIRRRWYQFSLRTMFVAVTLVAIPLAWVGYSLSWIRQRHEALQAGRVYDFSTAHGLQPLVACGCSAKEE
jgi:hypothetical protein